MVKFMVKGEQRTITSTSKSTPREKEKTESSGRAVFFIRGTGLYSEE